MLVILQAIALNAVMLVHDLVIPENVRLVDHGVGFRDGTDDFAWAAGGEGHRRNVPRDDGACADDTAITDRYARADDDVGTEPAVITDFDWFGVAEMGGLAVFVQHGAAFIGQHGMDGRDDCAVRAEIVVVADFDGCVVLYCEVVVEEIPFADFCVFSVMEENRPLHEGAFADLA